MEDELREIMRESKLIIVKSPFIFIWRGSHTVNVFGLWSEEELDCFSIGNYANDRITERDFKRGIKIYLRNNLEIKERIKPKINRSDK